MLCALGVTAVVIGLSRRPGCYGRAPRRAFLLHLKPMDQGTVRRALDLALAMLESPGCSQVYSDFQLPEGARPRTSWTRGGSGPRSSSRPSSSPTGAASRSAEWERRRSLRSPTPGSSSCAPYSHSSRSGSPRGRPPSSSTSRCTPWGCERTPRAATRSPAASSAGAGSTPGVSVLPPGSGLPRPDRPGGLVVAKQGLPEAPSIRTSRRASASRRLVPRHSTRSGSRRQRSGRDRARSSVNTRVQHRSAHLSPDTLGPRSLTWSSSSLARIEARLIRGASASDGRAYAPSLAQRLPIHRGRGRVAREPNRWSRVGHETPAHTVRHRAVQSRRFAWIQHVTYWYVLLLGIDGFS